MARKYELGPGRYAWSMEQCEERLLIAAYHDIETRLPPDLMWRSNFLQHFYVLGNGVTFSTVTEINGQLKRLSHETLDFLETMIFADYGNLPDRSLKAELRQRMRDQYLSLDTIEKVRWMRDAEDDISRLPPPQITFDEWKRRRDAQQQPVILSTRERAMRAEALEKPKISMTTAITDRAIRPLKLAKRADTIQRIIAALAPDQALAVAESGKIEDDDLVDSLVARSLEG